MGKATSTDVRDEAVENVINDAEESDRHEDEEREEREDKDDRAAPSAGVGTMSQYRWSWLKNTYTIFRREFWAYFDSPLAYIVIGLSLLAIGGWFFLYENNFWQVDRATMARLFTAMPVALSVICAVITMRSLAEEKRLGTIELLITMPVRDSEVIMGKFFAALGLVVVLLLLTLLYPLAMFVWPWHLGPLDWGVVWTSYLGLVFWAGAAIAIGMLFSSITESQIISLFLTLATLLTLVAIGLLVEPLKGWMGDTLAFVSFQTRYGDFARGLIDLRAVIYFVSVAVIALLIAFRNLESRKWS